MTAPNALCFVLFAKRFLGLDRAGPRFQVDVPIALHAGLCGVGRQRIMEPGGLVALSSCVAADE